MLSSILTTRGKGLIFGKVRLPTRVEVDNWSVTAFSAALSVFVWAAEAIPTSNSSGRISLPISIRAALSLPAAFVGHISLHSFGRLRFHQLLSRVSFF